MKGANGYGAETSSAFPKCIPKDYSTTDPVAAEYKDVPLVHSNSSKQKPFAVAIPGPNPTLERIPFIPTKEGPLTDGGVARANLAPSIEQPNGSEFPYEEGMAWHEKHKTKTVLQQHAAYWDKDGDGIIWPLDTYRGLRAWGWNIFLSLLATGFINLGLSYPTGPNFPMPDPFFRIYLNKLHKDHHGSSSGSYDAEGRFKPQAFEDIWAKYDRDGKGGLTLYEMWEAHKGQRMVFDFFGWFATFLEWVASYLLVWPEDGVLRKEDMRRIIDGSIFQEKADQYERKKGRKIE